MNKLNPYQAPRDATVREPPSLAPLSPASFVEELAWSFDRQGFRCQRAVQIGNQTAALLCLREETVLYFLRYFLRIGRERRGLNPDCRSSLRELTPIAERSATVQTVPMKLTRQ